MPFQYKRTGSIMLELALISAVISVITGTLIMFCMVKLFRYKVRFINVLIINVVADISAELLEVYTEPLVTRALCVFIMMLLLKHFTEIKNWGSIMVIAVIANLCAAITVFGMREMVVIPMLNDAPVAEEMVEEEYSDEY